MRELGNCGEELRELVEGRLLGGPMLECAIDSFDE
jgi:hypothetical protein